MRVAVVDIGSNSTRLLIADVAGGRVDELDRRSVVTRLGADLERSGRLGETPQARVFAVLAEYAEAIREYGCERATAVLTSAARDATNGAEFTQRVRAEYDLDARTLSGDEEARLTFRGATAARGEDTADLLVIDIGGGSTELVLGSGFHVSTQNGVVRHTERHLRSDPPAAAEIRALVEDVAADLRDRVPPAARRQASAAVGVAGTATQCAAIDLELEPYDPAKVEGHVLTAHRLGKLSRRLAALPARELDAVKGLDPARAPVIVAGVYILRVVLSVFGLDAVAASERDLLWGAALEIA
jgi:exopolyphosphatase / guanosine-5'-triphosphate,3'-diphosphate pyrophosphatase